MFLPFRDPLLLAVHINELMDMTAKFKIYHVFNIYVTCSQKRALPVAIFDLFIKTICL